jgi:signal transduction histidine kinase
MLRRLLTRANAASGNSYGLGLHLRLVFAGAVTSFLGVATVCGFLVYQQVHVFQAEIGRSTAELRIAMVERGRILGESLAKSMENAIAGYNFTFVAESMNLLKESKDNLAYGYVTNSAGTVIVHTDTNQVGEHRAIPLALQVGGSKEVPGERPILEIYHPIVVGGEVWGNMVLAFHLWPLQARAAEALLHGREVMIRSTSTAVLFAGLVTLMGIAGSIVLSRRLLAPITILADDASAIATGNLSREIRAVDSGDEIGFLAQQFELMRRSVRTYIGELVIAKEKAEAATREEKRLRAQLQEHSKLLELKVQERTAELQNINARLTENDRLKSEFLSNVSHELRSPLAAISSAAKIIDKYGDRSKKDGAKFSNVIMYEADRLGRLINDLLDLAKIEAGRVEWNFEPIDDPVDLIAHVVTTFKPLAAESNVDLTLDCTASLPRVTGDKDRLIQVLTNLLSNAMKFTPSGGSITVGGERMELRGKDVVRFVVQDTGPGIPEHELEKVFDRFHQVKVKKTATNKPKGTGLGLAICREVVNHHGGEIWAEAAPVGTGARMVFYIPIGDRAVQEDAPSTEPASNPA